MDFLNKANTVASNVQGSLQSAGNLYTNLHNTYRGAASGQPMPQFGQPIPQQSIQKQAQAPYIYHPYSGDMSSMQGLQYRENFVDTSTSQQWWIIILLLILLFAMLYWKEKKTMM